MRTRLAALPLLAVLVLSGCSGGSDDDVSEEGVPVSPSAEADTGGLDAPSGDPLAPTPAATS